MNDNLYQNKYRISSTRLPERDYRSGDYFITICTKNRENYFWEIIDGEMKLNELWNIVNNYWLEIPIHFPDVLLDEFVIMPNHVHGILSIEKTIDKSVETQNIVSNYNIVSHWNQTHNYASLQEWNENKFWPQIRNLWSIIRWFKSAVTTYSRIHNIEFWRQPRFYEHIIRDEKELNNTREYINSNPLKFDVNEANSDY